VSLNWTDPNADDLGHVEVTWSPEDGGSQPKKIDPGTEQAQITGLSNGTEYTFTLKSVDTADNVSSGVTISATPGPPSAPSNLQLSVVSDTQIDLSWTDNAANETGFEVELDGTVVASDVAADTESYSDTGLSSNTSYDYRVRAVNAAGASAWTNAESATTLATYTVTYNANGATSGTAPADQTKIEGTALTLADNTNGLDVTGYQVFAGWNTASDGSGDSYAAGATYSADANLTLYAQWSAIGETGEAGGIIFYDDEADGTDDISGARYLEAWTADEGSYQWKTVNSSSGTSTAVGSGYENTYNAMTGTQHPAANVVRNATHGGSNDWFLPSKDELHLMYQNKGAIGGFASDYYWSSSENADFYGSSQDFGSGIQDFNNKGASNRVRAIRAF
jgi:uncharacterized repeat protein (TIGR02543 family)